MATLQTPPTPTYGPDTFTQLGQMAQVILANDQALNDAIGSGGGGGTSLTSIVGNDNASAALQNPSGDVAVPIPVVVAAPSASNTQATAGTKTLRGIIQTLVNNIAYLLANMGVGQSKGAISFASGYSQYSTAYVTPKAIKTGTVCTLEAGPVGCPSSISASTYYTWGTLPSGYAPTDGLHRLGVGMMYMGSTGSPIQCRVNANGNLEYVSPGALSGITYFVPPSGMQWSVA